MHLIGEVVVKRPDRGDLSGPGRGVQAVAGIPAVLVLDPVPAEVRHVAVNVRQGHGGHDDGVVDLINAGVITNKCKQIDKGQCVATFLMGTKKLYDFVDNNPMVQMKPVDIVNDPRVICQNDNVVSINSCVEVDLMGQVCSESVGLKQISGVGGQVDFVRGANMSKGGRTIMAMPATAAKGTISKIVPLLAEGAAVTTSRCDVDYVVTEYGIAKLHGCTLKERARQLIHIAAPAFRESLKQEYENRFRCKLED